MEGLETFELNLIAAVVDPDIALEGSATLGEAINIQVTIIDDEMPGGVDPGFKLDGGANGPVYSILVDQDERILMGGDFTRVGGVNYGHVSRLHPDGYVDSSFNVGTGLDDIVWSLGVQADHKPVPGGRYENVDGNQVEALGRLNADGVFDDTFSINEGVELTGTFKHVKGPLKEKGFDVQKNTDPLYVWLPKTDKYVPLTQQMQKDIEQGLYRY